MEEKLARLEMEDSLPHAIEMRAPKALGGGGKEVLALSRAGSLKLPASKCERVVETEREERCPTQAPGEKKRWAVAPRASTKRAASEVAREQRRTKRRVSVRAIEAKRVGVDEGGETKRERVSPEREQPSGALKRC